MNTIDTVKATTYRALRKLATLIFAIGMLGSLPSAHASDAFSVTVDVDGSDDVPLQEDVTQMGFDTSHLSESDPYWSVFFAFDDVATTSASQTLDGCAFFDANKDGYADFSVCASLSSKVTGEPATLSSAALYDCKDSENTGDQGSRCPFVGGGGDGSNGIIAQDLNGDGIFESDGDGNALSAQLDSWVALGSDADPFSGDPLHISGNCRSDVTGSCLQSDSGITFKLFVDEFNELTGSKPLNPTDMTLTNVCSFTSVDPGSERKDCIVNPGSGFIKIIKNVADGDPDSTFHYTLDADANNDCPSTFSDCFASILTISNTGESGNLAVEGGITHTLLEVLPDDKWQIDSATCDNGTDLLDPNGQQGGQLFVGPGEVVTCTFENSIAFVPVPAIKIIKTAVDSAPDTHLWNDTDGDGYPDAGETIDYEFDVQNTGNVDLSSVDVIDVLVEIQSAPLGNIYCPATTLATDPDLEEPFEGDLITCTASYVLTQADINAGQVYNVAKATGTDPYDTVVEDTDPETVLLPPNAALKLVKTATPTTYDNVGDEISYSYVVSNSGNVSLAGPVTVSDDKTTVSCPAVTTVGNLDDFLDPGESVTCTASYTITQADLNGGSVTNTATASAGGTDSNQDQATVTANKSPSLTVQKDVDLTTINAPETLKYTITVKNTGNVDITNVVLSDDLAGAATLDSGDAVDAGVLNVGETWTYSASYAATQTDINAGDDLVNTASVVSTEVPGPTKDSATTSITQNAALTIDKVVDLTTISAPGTLTYTITVDNTGNVDLTNVVLDDVFAGGATLSSGDDGDGVLETDEIWIYTADYDATQADINAGTDLVNVAGVDTDQTDRQTDSATTTITQNPVLMLVKTATPTTYDSVGDVISYGYLVSNSGNVTLTGPVTVSDDKTTVTCPLGNLEPSSSITCLASYTITQADLNGGSVTNTAQASAVGTYSNQDQATVTATQTPALTLVKTATPTTYGSVGDVISYSYVVSNSGNVSLTGPVTVSDDKTTVSCPAVTTDGNLDDFLDPGESVTCTASYTITQDDLNGGSVTNTAQASADGTDSNQDQATVTADQDRALTIVKQALDLGSDGALGGDDDTWVETTTIMPDDVAAFQITVTNTGNVTIYGTKLEDSLPNPNTDVPDLIWSVASQSGVTGCTITSGTELVCGGDIALAPGQSFTVVVSTTIPSDYFTRVAPGGNGTLGSNFEIDGNTQLDVLTDPDLRDWNGAVYSAMPDVPSGQTDDSFGKGSKNDHETPTVVDGSIPNNKSDLVTMAAAAEGVGTANFIYLAWLRAETLGTVNIDFELNQSSVPSANGVTPQRSLNDVIISFDFTAGENVVQLSLRKWLGAQWSEPEDLSAPDMNLAKGAVNDPVAFPGVQYPSKDLDGIGDIAELTFGEAVINATEAFGSVGCRTFNSVYVKSRSSTSFTAALKDFIAPQQVQINTCATIELRNTATVTSSVPEASDGAIINVTNDLAVAEAWRTAPID